MSILIGSPFTKSFGEFVHTEDEKCKLLNIYQGQEENVSLAQLDTKT